MTAMHAVHDVDPVHVRAGTNFGMSRRQLVTHVVLPAIVPQLIVGMRIALGIAWLVVVAAEMIAVNSGLGFLIVDARSGEIRAAASHRGEGAALTAFTEPYEPGSTLKPFTVAGRERRALERFDQLILELVREQTLDEAIRRVGRR